MDHVRRIDGPRGRPPVDPVPRVRRTRRDDERDDDRERRDGTDGPPADDRPPPRDGGIDVLA